MKKFFSTIFLVFVSLYTFGQSTANASEALFYFTNGTKINPAVAENQIPLEAGHVFKNGLTGNRNTAFGPYFNYSLPMNTFNPVSIKPAEGAVEEMPQTIELDFRDPIGNRANKDNPGDIQYIVADITDTKTGVVIGAAQGSLKPGTENILVLTSNLPADARTKRGIYTITVPEQRVFNRFYNTTSSELRYNSEIVITYKVAGADAPSEAVLAEANALLAKSGVGYPKADAAERTALEEAVDAEELGDDAFRTLMNNFMASTDIELPAADKYYTIANVQKDGSKFYLAYDGEAVSLTADAANAYSFKAATTDDATTGNVRTFATADGKYLHSLTASSDYSAVTTSNVTAEKTAASSLTLSKALVASETETLFGCISMQGLVGKKYGDGDDIIAFSHVSNDGTVGEFEQTVYFNANVSGAFFFAEAEAPKIITKYNVTINPVTETGVVEALESIVVTFPELTAVTLADASKISLKGVKTNAVVPVEGTPVVEGNTVTIKFGELTNDTYTFTAAEGAFTYSKDEETVAVQEITASFTVFYIGEFVYDLNDLPNRIFLDNNWGNNKINPHELNNLSIQLHDDCRNSIETYLNPNAEVELVYNMQETVAKGKFEKYTTSETYNEIVFIRNGVEMGVVSIKSGTTVELVDGTKYTDFGLVSGDKIVVKVRTKYCYHMKLNLDKEMNEKTAKDGVYWFKIPAETFGDAMYNSWLNGTTAAKHDCHVNRSVQIAIETDKTATAITNVNADETQNDVIYDISGRRVKNTAKPGLYIMNGKKFVLKNNLKI